MKFEEDVDTCLYAIFYFIIIESWKYFRVASEAVLQSFITTNDLPFFFAR